MKQTSVLYVTIVSAAMQIANPEDAVLAQEEILALLEGMRVIDLKSKQAQSDLGALTAPPATLLQCVHLIRNADP
jgi:hypothetical protein